MQDIFLQLLFASSGKLAVSARNRAKEKNNINAGAFILLSKYKK
jgi:hypothetical protein